MKFQKQLLRSDAFSGTAGDCYRTVIAVLLNMDALSVPHFYEDSLSDNKPEWNFEGAVEGWIDQWLLEQGHIRIRTLVSGRSGTLDDLYSLSAAFTPKHYPVLVSGESKNGMGHVVIVQDGKLLWDPSPDDCGLKRPFDVGFWMFEWLARPIQMEDTK